MALVLACALGSPALAHDTDVPTPEAERDPGAGAATPPPPAPPPRPIDLLPRVTLAESVGWIFAPEPEPSTPEERGERYVDRMLWEHVMRDALDHVGGDGWYHQLGQAMRRGLTVDMRAATQERRRGMNVVQRLADELGRYANGPSAPQGAPSQLTSEQRNPSDPVQQQHDNVAEHMNLRNAPVQWHRVDVRITQAPDGALLAVWIIRSSGNTVIDRAVLAAVRDGVTRVPPPPHEIVGDRNAIVSEWSVEVGDVATYWNQAGCVIRPEGGVDCAALGRGILRTRLRLLRVLDDRHPSFEEERSVRHRERQARRRRLRQLPPPPPPP